MAEHIDPQHFRRVLGHFPTGVAAVTACGEDGEPLGMTVGSFTSVSLNPPLVAFLPGKSSRTAPRIVRSGRFCVNVLGAHQEPVSRAFATGGDRKFESLAWEPSPTGLPRLDSAVAWIECDVQAVHDAGDHDIVIGRVTSLDAAGPPLPLLFFQGGYGRFAPLSFAAAGQPDLVEHLRLVDVARPFMEEVAALTGTECQASSAVGEEIVLLATAGTPADGRPFSRVGQRLPLIAPLGTVLVAWSEQATERWLARSELAAPEGLVERVRSRGWSAAVWSDELRRLEASVDRTTLDGVTPHGSSAVRELIGRLSGEYEPADIEDPRHHLRSLTVPVFDARGAAVLQLTLYGMPKGARPAEYLEPLTAVARNVSGALSRRS